MKTYWAWLDLPAIAVFVFFGWIVWPEGIWTMPFTSWTLEELVEVVFSIALLASAVGLIVVPYALPLIQAQRAGHVYREVRERGRN